MFYPENEKGTKKEECVFIGKKKIMKQQNGKTDSFEGKKPALKKDELLGVR